MFEKYSQLIHEIMPMFHEMQFVHPNNRPTGLDELTYLGNL